MPSLDGSTRPECRAAVAGTRRTGEQRGWLNEWFGCRPIRARRHELRPRKIDPSGAELTGWLTAGLADPFFLYLFILLFFLSCVFRSGHTACVHCPLPMRCSIRHSTAYTRSLTSPCLSPASIRLCLQYILIPRGKGIALAAPWFRVCDRASRVLRLQIAIMHEPNQGSDKRYFVRYWLTTEASKYNRNQVLTKT